MPLDITFTLSDKDLERFKAIVSKSKSGASDNQGQAEIRDGGNSKGSVKCQDHTWSHIPQWSFDFSSSSAHWHNPLVRFEPMTFPA